MGAIHDCYIAEYDGAAHMVSELGAEHNSNNNDGMASGPTFYKGKIETSENDGHVLDK